MLKAKLIPQLLGQINTDGLELTFLMIEDGSLVGSAGQIKLSKTVETKVVAAILSNIWSDYVTVGQKMSTDTGKLSCVLLECEEGRIAAMRVGPRYILAAFGGVNMQPGLLKLKLDKLRLTLDGTLNI
mmetsp:Transcript_860/g.1058  ORF Transcript_860/g.1058 Transcript_860/m.1058 type:complete len:128 (+) Transcript_860:479-862(+)